MIFKPVAGVYKSLPTPIKSGVGNSLENLSNIVTIPNNSAQENFRAGLNTGRFIINTTIGILGLIDVAALIGLNEYEKEDYGQTLAVHGVGRDVTLFCQFRYEHCKRYSSLVSEFYRWDAWYNVTVKMTLNTELRLLCFKNNCRCWFEKNYDSIENLKTNSIDFYASVKSLYLQDRQQRILNANTIVNTQNDSDWEEIEN